MWGRGLYGLERGVRDIAVLVDDILCKERNVKSVCGVGRMRSR
jgi:hypothetical protein